MPRVPKHPIPTVKDRPISPVFQTGAGAGIRAFGGDTGLTEAGKGLRGVSDQLAQIAVNMQADENDRISKDGVVELDGIIRSSLYGDEENRGFLSLAGKDSLGAYSGVVERIQTERERISEGMSEAVLKIYNAGADQSQKGFLNKVAVSVATNRKVANLRSSEARKESAIEDAATAYNDPKEVKSAFAKIRGEVHAQANIRGWGEDRLKLELQTALDTTVSKMVGTAIGLDDIPGAQSILDAYGAMLSGTVRSNLVKSLREPKRIEQIEKGRDIILNAQIENGWSQARTRKEIKRAFTGQIETGILEAVKKEWAAQKAFKDQNEEATETEMSTAIANGMSIDKIMKTDLRWAALPQITKERLIRGAEIAAEGKDHLLVSDGVTEDWLLALDEDVFRTVPIGNYKSSLTDGEWDNVFSMQRAAVNSMGAKAEKLTIFHGALTALRRLSPQLLWGSKDQDPEVTGPLIKKMRAWVQDNFDKGKTPTPVEVDEFATLLLADVLVPGMLWGENKVGLVGQLDQLEPKEQAKARIKFEHISEEEVGKIRALRSRLQLLPLSKTDEETWIGDYYAAILLDDLPRRDRMIKEALAGGRKKVVLEIQ